MTGALHDDELSLDVSRVRALLDRDVPEYRTLPVRRLQASGSSNALFRLGDDLLVRLPRQPGGSATIDKEARWLPSVASLLPVPVPEIVAVGQPGFGYPERWSVVRWLDGEVPAVVGAASDAEPSRIDLARDLAAVANALRHVEVTPGARADPDLRWYRGGPLADQDARTRRDIDACRDIPGLDLDLDAALQVWEDAMASPEVQRSSSDAWYHGDLLAENLLVRDGRLAAVLDFGGLSVGDPTVDLIAAWELLDPEARAVFRDEVGLDDGSWLRARAWALTIALMTFPYYWHTMPGRCETRLAMARAVLADAAGAGSHSTPSSRG